MTVKYTIIPSAERIGKGIEKLIQQIKKREYTIDILLVSPIEHWRRCMETAVRYRI